MKLLRKTFTDLDYFSAKAILRIDKQAQVKSCPIGFLSFLILSFFIYWFTTMCIDLFSYGQIRSQMQQTLDEDTTNPSGNIQMFAVNLDNIPIQQFQKMFQFQFSTFVDGQQSQTQNFSLQPCTYQHFSMFGSETKKVYDEFDFTQMYCLKLNQSTIQLNGVHNSFQQKYGTLVLKFCDWNTNPNCDNNAGMQWIIQRKIQKIFSSQMYLYIVDKAIYPDRKDPVGYTINEGVRLQITPEKSTVSVIYISNFQIDTDTSFTPFQHQETIVGSRVNRVKYSQSTFNTNSGGYVSAIVFQMNDIIQTYTRTLGKLDSVLSYIGGLFAILIGAIAIFLTNYNQYRYELAVAESAFNVSSDGEKFKKSDLNFFVYIKLTIFDWVKSIFRKELPWEYYKKLYEAVQQTEQILEFNRLYNRILAMEGIIQQLVGEDRVVLGSLMKLSTIQEAKQRRLIGDYYDQILQFSEKINLRDVQNKHKNQPQKIATSMRIQQNIQIPALLSFLQSQQFIKKADCLILPSQLQEVQKILFEKYNSMTEEVRVELRKQFPPLFIYRVLFKQMLNNAFLTNLVPQPNKND